MRLQAGDHHHQPGRAQRHRAGLGQGLVEHRRLGFGLFLGDRAGEQFAECVTRAALHAEETPGPQLAVIRRAQGGTEDRLALRRIRCGFLQPGHGNTLEQSVQSLHRATS